MPTPRTRTRTARRGRPIPIALRAALAGGLAASGTLAAVGAPNAWAATGSATPTAPSGPTAAAGTLAYSLLTSSGSLVGYGGAFSASVVAPASPVVGVASTSDGHGAYAAEANGTVVALGDAAFHGSMAGTRLAQPIVGVATDPATGGYWLVAADGGVFSFGGAGFYGSTGGIHLDQPVVGMAAAPSGRGYWLVASDGGVFAYGDAGFYGSTGGVHLAKPIIAMSPTADGRGYWMVASDGGVFNYGDAPFYGSATDMHTRVVGMATGAADGYANPLRAVTGLRPERVDEGVDYGGSGPIYALGDGVITSTSGAWPDGTYISYRLTNGPAVGRMVYVAENVTPTVTVGQTVTPGTVIGTLHDAYPDMEIGWAADQYGDTMAADAGQWGSAAQAASAPTAYGINFNQLLVSLGAPSGVMVSSSVSGVLPTGWPGW